MSLIKKIVFNICLVCCSSLFIPSAVYAFEYEASYFKECGQERVLISRALWEHRYTSRKILTSRDLLQGSPLFCIKRKDRAVNFFLNPRGFGVSFRISM